MVYHSPFRHNEENHEVYTSVERDIGVVNNLILSAISAVLPILTM